MKYSFIVWVSLQLDYCLINGIVEWSWFFSGIWTRKRCSWHMVRQWCFMGLCVGRSSLLLFWELIKKITLVINKISQYPDTSIQSLMNVFRITRRVISTSRIVLFTIQSQNGKELKYMNDKWNLSLLMNVIISVGTFLTSSDLLHIFIGLAIELKDSISNHL